MTPRPSGCFVSSSLRASSAVRPAPMMRQRFWREIPVESLGLVESHRDHRDRMTGDLSPSADKLAACQSSIYQSMEHFPGDVRLTRRRVGALDLSHDLIIAKHHGVESSGKSKEVADHLVFALDPASRLGNGRPAAIPGEEELIQRLQSTLHLRNLGIDLDPVAGGNNHSFGDTPAQFLKGSRQRFLAERNLFEDSQGCRSLMCAQHD